MDLKYRRILYIFFILAFFIITPLIWLYASGYSLTGGFKLEKTGILILDSKPKGAKIFLNDKLQKKFFNKIISNSNYIGTPAKIKNLKPGEYEVRLELENYWSWQKKLKIKPGQSTFAEDIILFKKSTPLEIIANCENNFSVSPNEKYLIAGAKNTAIFHKLKTKDQEIFLASHNVNFNNALWSDNQEKIISENYIFNINNWQEPIEIKKIINGEKLKWKSNKELYYLNKGKLYSYDIEKKSIKNIIDQENVLNYLPKNNKIYFISKKQDKLFLKEFNIDDSKIKKISELKFGKYDFINENNKLINLYEENSKNLYLINPELPFKRIRKIIKNLKQSQWIDDDKLLYSNDYEIYILDLKSLNEIFLTRISKKITNILWHPSNNYIIFADQKNINVLELDNREKRNITNIFQANNISKLKLDKKGKNLYFFAKIKDKQGIYKLGL